MPRVCCNCGTALADRAAFCSACGIRVQVPECNPVGQQINGTPVESAVVPAEQPPSHLGTLPYEIGRAHGKRGVLIAVAITFAVVLLLFAVLSSQSDHAAATSTAGSSESPQIDSYIPQPQKSFTYMIESFIPSYNSADTEVRKTNVRFERKNAIIHYFSRSGGLRFQGWVGELQDLRTESDGKASFSVKLKGSETAIVTWNNSLSDIGSNTMISRNDALYPALMDIKNGDEVTVSGTFVVEGVGQDYVREASLTEDGSMTSPEFIVRFSQIGKGSVRTSAPVLNDAPIPTEEVVRPEHTTDDVVANSTPPVQNQSPTLQQSPQVPPYIPPVQDVPSAQAPVDVPATPTEAPRSDVLMVTVIKTKVVQHIDPMGHAMLLAKAYRKDAPDDRFSLICHTARSSCTSLREGEDYNARILQPGDQYYDHDYADLKGAVIVRIGNAVFALMREKKVAEQ